MTDNTSIRYAIRLPSGKLAHDLPGDVREGQPEYATLPNGDRAWLWSEEQQHKARNTIRNIADTVTHWGLSDVFSENAHVVMVRTTVEIVDGDHDPGRDDEQAAEPRTWHSVREIPVGVAFRQVGGSYRYRRALAGCVLIDGSKYIPLSEFPDAPEGFIEVLPEESPKPEPRLWANAVDVPTGVVFQTADVDRAYPVHWTRDGGSCIAGGPHGDGNRYSLLEVESSWGAEGFIEVL